MEKKSNKTYQTLATSLFLMFVSSSVFAADLTQMINGGNTLVLSLAKFLTSAAALLGGWFVVSGVLAWKKSSNEHGGQQIEFKSVALPILTGIILVSFTGFILLTSSTFGFMAPNTGNF